MGIAFSEPVVEPPPMTTEERAKAEAELIKERKKFFMKQARVMEREIEKLEEDAKEKRLRIMEDAKSKAKGLEDKNVRELIKQYIWSKVRRRAARQSVGAAGQLSGGAAAQRALFGGQKRRAAGDGAPSHSHLALRAIRVRFASMTCWRAGIAARLLRALQTSMRAGAVPHPDPYPPL